MIRTLALAFVIVATMPALAVGQSGPGGLFGATRPASSDRDVLSLQMSISEALDSDVPPEVRSRLLGGNLPIGRRSNIIAPDLAFAHGGRRLGLFAAASGFFRYSYAIGEMQPGPARANAGAEVRMSRAGVLSVSQTLGYSPSYLYELLPVESQPDGELPMSSSPEYQIDSTESLAHKSRANLTIGSGLGLSLSTTADYGRVTFRRAEFAQRERTLYSAGTRLSYRPRRTHGFLMGYRYRAAEFGPGVVSDSHELPLGFEYTPAISRSRRVAVRVEVAPTMIDMPAMSIDGSQDVLPERRQFPVQGDVSLEYPFHLKWRFAAGYSRSVQYLSVLSEPAVTEGARLGLSGLLGRRVDLQVQGRYATAESRRVDGRESQLTTASGDARMRVAVSRWFAFFNEYVYYLYDFGDQRPLGSNLPRMHRQHRVSAGVVLFAQPLGR